ncbi:hypothetical protein E4L96_10635 [Massilia arenosa]|uniref:Uncharacterized protein n=1 Tax=Zemynaea arenosa TaxID=2561931 RepID=A0A4Y9SHW8_9BURK|nr:hypothetical protein [Massilia arenosa]TFW20170.1 hypothetical protein E4L96_10635 [Massilia arenosa]
MHRSLLLAPLFVATHAGAASLPAPMVDGDCAEFRPLGARMIALSPQVQLFVYEDEHYVWMCYTLPPGSMGQLDMVLATPALPAALNLHVSAQLGEWPAGRPELVPKNAESDAWWQVQGWTANTLHVNGMDTSGQQPRYRWKETPGRELQLSKARFGHGTWTVSMTIYGIGDGHGRRADLHFPAQGSVYSLPVK